MKERPILFSAPMVRAILDGSKTQTRRAKGIEWFSRQENDPARWRCARVRDGVAFFVFENSPVEREVRCRYGMPGDRLWVRETHLLDPPNDGTWDYHGYTDGEIHNRSVIPPRFQNPRHVLYRSTWQGDDNLRWMPSIHMPRWASRITLEITGVRVERLQAISDADARAEGVGGCDRGKESAFECSSFVHFLELWESINGPESWAANPWVWVVEFKRVTP